MDLKQLQGVAVVSIAAGEKIGEVKDVLINDGQRRVAALRVESGGMLHRQYQLLPFSAVQSIGADAVMIPEAAVLVPVPGNAPAGQHVASELSKMRVVTENGAYLGNISNARFDPATGEVTEFEIGGGGIGGVLGHKKVINASSVTSIGADIMIVPDTMAADETRA